MLPTPHSDVATQVDVTLKPRLRRAEASVYLRKQHGVERKPTTLAKLACVGGGPRFQKIGNTPLYEPAELDRWVVEKLGPLVTSTSDTGEVAE